MKKITMYTLLLSSSLLLAPEIQPNSLKLSSTPATQRPINQFLEKYHEHESNVQCKATICAIITLSAGFHLFATIAAKTSNKPNIL